MDKAERKKRVMDKLLEYFIQWVRDINVMDEEELDQLNKDLLNALHEGQTGIGLGTN